MFFDLYLLQTVDNEIVMRAESLGDCDKSAFVACC
jgi:hypothetical protein